MEKIITRRLERSKEKKKLGTKVKGVKKRGKKKQLRGKERGKRGMMAPLGYKIRIRVIKAPEIDKGCAIH